MLPGIRLDLKINTTTCLALLGIRSAWACDDAHFLGFIHIPTEARTREERFLQILVRYR